MIKKILIILLVFLTVVFLFLFVGEAPKKEEISWGVTFSQKYAKDLNLDWRETYLAILDDLEVRKIRIPFYWDLVEPEKEDYDFKDMDWMINEATKREVDMILVVGIKVPRWPECHIPSWADSYNKERQQNKILKLIEEIVFRYKDNNFISYWQVENEPFLDFGDCPWYDKDFVLKEVDLVRKIDPDTPILVSESGELSTWFPGARIADIVGTTMYFQTWWHRAGGFYFNYPIPPVHYYRKSLIIDRIFNKDVICVEFQAEPWGPAPTYVISLEEQEKSMNLEKFRNNIDYAKRTGISEFYFWGVEWWYWMKEVNNQPEFWEEARQFF